MRTPWFLVGVVTLVACGDSGSETPPDAPTDAALLCTHIQSLRTFRGKAQTFGTTNGAAFPGNICIDGRATIECPQPAANRDFEMCVPSEGDFGMRFIGGGFETTVIHLGPQAQTGTFSIGDDAYVGSKFWMPIGGTYPPSATTGHLVVLVIDGAGMPVPNAEIAILPSAGTNVVYIGANGLPDVTRTTTSTAGSALIADLAPADYDLQINSTLASCAFSTGGHVSPDNSQDARVPVAAAATTVATLRCM